MISIYEAPHVLEGELWLCITCADKVKEQGHDITERREVRERCEYCDKDTEDLEAELTEDLELERQARHG